MNEHRHTMLLAAIGILVLLVGGAPAEAGGGFELHFGSAGFGVSMAYGDWGVYTAAWSQPRWSFGYEAALAGYGEWVWVDGLGRVWRPWVKTGWQPYTYGRWVATAYGWTWVAYEPWGYFPHHYGNWALTGFGWVWAPGYTYHAAGVVWVKAGSYIGWYAAPPRGWCHADHGFRAGYNRGYRDGYDRGYDDGWRDARYATYVPWKSFGSDNVSHHKVAPSVASRSRVKTLDHSPSAREVREHGGTPFVETSLATRSAEVDGHQVQLVRPVGVAGSVERHASETIHGTLTPAALNARRQKARPVQSSRRESGQPQPSGSREPIVPTRADAGRGSSRTQSSSSTPSRPEARASRVEVRNTAAPMAPRAKESTTREMSPRQSTPRISSRVSQVAAPRILITTESRSVASRVPVRTAPRATGDERETVTRQNMQSSVRTAERESSGELRTDIGKRRLSSRKGTTTSGDTEERPSTARSSRRTGARKR